jgi:hypothetical protein
MSTTAVADRTFVSDPVFEAKDASAWPAPSAESDAIVIDWGSADEVLARYCQMGLSGTLRIDAEPGIRVFLHDGLVYFAEQTTDPELGLRLVLDGVITDEQLDRGSRLIERGRHLGQMFVNDPSIDSDLAIEAVVRYCTETINSLTGLSVTTHAFLPDEHHSSGILAWYSFDDEIVVSAEPMLEVEAAPVEVAPFAEVASTLSEWLGPVECEPLVVFDEGPPAVVDAARLPRRSRSGDAKPTAVRPDLGEAGLSAADLSVLQTAITNIRASSVATLAAREVAPPVVSADTEVAGEHVPGSPAERRRWVARRQR